MTCRIKFLLFFISLSEGRKKPKGFYQEKAPGFSLHFVSTSVDAGNIKMMFSGLTGDFLGRLRKG